MTERVNKKRKSNNTEKAVAKGTITDPRFANIQSDPRFRLPGKKHKVKLDSRFSQALRDDDFSRQARVDRYGRSLETEVERKRLKRKYEFEDDESDEESDDADDDADVQRELRRINQARDSLRKGKYSDSSSTSSSSDEDMDSDLEVEEAELAPQTQSDVPIGEVSSRLAVVNLDWDNIRAQDLMAVFSSFLDSGGQLQHVAIYPSEFGKERLRREEMEGPPQEIFTRAGAKAQDVSISDSSSSSDDDEDDEAIKSSMLKGDNGADFDSQALRRYQLERLRYFYAVLTFSSAAAAKKIYDAVDGTEYLSTANFFDLRFVPEATDFSADAPQEECNNIPADYRPNTFVTDALQHSKVKLTWDAEDATRKEAQARAFRGDRKEVDENDLRAYLGSDSSATDSDIEDAGPVIDDAPVTTQSKRSVDRAKMRALLGLEPEPSKSRSLIKEKRPIGNVQITFTAGLSGDMADEKKRSVFVNTQEEANETTLERYMRKEKERKLKRREKAKASRHDHPDDEDQGSDVELHPAGDEQSQGATQKDDLGFEDPFFAESTPAATDSRAASRKLGKEERLKKRQQREEDESRDRKQRAELELLMADDVHDNENNDSGKSGHGERKETAKVKSMRHFDMRDIERAEKEERKRSKKARGKSKSKTAGRSDIAKADTTAADDFRLNTTDPRFATRLFQNHEFAIDPTNPKYKETKVMKALLEEGRRRKRDTSSKHFRKNEAGESSSIDHGAKALAEKLKQKETK